MKKKITLGLSALALGLAGAAYAAPGDAPRGANRDAVTTRADVESRAAERFAKLDVNRDGKIDQTDRQARRAARQTARFDRLDADRNGQLSREEFTARPARNAGHAAHDGAGHKMRGHRGHRGGMMMGRTADADKDGAITRAEFTAAAVQRFERHDANSDGRVTPEERQAARGKMRHGAMAHPPAN